MGTSELLGKPNREAGGESCDALASHPEGSIDNPSCFTLKSAGDDGPCMAHSIQWIGHKTHSALILSPTHHTCQTYLTI